MLARAALAAAGEAIPAGAIALAEPAGGGAARLPPSTQADWALLSVDNHARLLPMGEAAEDAEATSAFGRVLRWPADAGRPAPGVDYATAGAWAEAAVMAGTMERILEDTVRHARDRRQFGRPVAAFQAVQQQLSVLTEDVLAARMAVQLASIPDGAGIAGLNACRVATAKLRVGEAGVRVAGIAHAVQGAMGITEEVDLHLLTGRLQLGRMRFGGEAHWAAWLGRRFLADDAPDTLSFVRAQLAPAPPEDTP
jgi:acyl-CoA dehydrogenase